MDGRFRVKRLKDAMRYGEKEYCADWATVVALSMLMGLHGPMPYQEAQAEHAMDRVLAYLELHPDTVPWRNHD